MVRKYICDYCKKEISSNKPEWGIRYRDMCEAFNKSLDLHEKCYKIVKKKVLKFRMEVF